MEKKGELLNQLAIVTDLLEKINSNNIKIKISKHLNSHSILEY